MRRRPAIAMLALAVVSFAASSAAGAYPDANPDADASGWLPGPARAEPADGAGKVWFSREFRQASGVYPAIYRDIVYGPDRIAGDFLIGAFRYTYERPIGEGDGPMYPQHDESINEVMLDCERGFNGEVRTRYLLAGNEVFVDQHDEDLILMIQNTESEVGATAAALCEFARTQAAK